MLAVVEAFFGLQKHVVDIGLHCVTQQRSEYLSHQPLISCPNILQAERHHMIAVYPVQHNEGLFLCVKQVHGNLMIPGESFQEQQYFVPGYGNNLVCLWQGESIFWACFVEVSVIYTYAPLTNHHHVS